MNKLIYTLSAAGLAAVSLTGIVNAQDAATDEMAVPGELSFAAVDADQSGDVTLDEITVIDPEFGAELYAQADVDGNGSLNETEFNTLLEADVLTLPSVG